MPATAARAALAQAPTVILIDNRAEQCDASSRIAEGNRRRAKIEAYRLARQARSEGREVRIVTLEPGDRSVADGVIIRADCR